MSKQFVTFDRFNAEVKSLRNDLDDLIIAHNDIIHDKWGELDQIKEVVNANADNGEEVEARLNELTKRVDKLSRHMQAMQNDLNMKNSDGVGTAICVGALSLIGFCWLASEISRLSKEIEKLEAKRNSEGCKCVPNPEVTFRVQSDTEDPNITYTGTTKED